MWDGKESCFRRCDWLIWISIWVTQNSHGSRAAHGGTIWFHEFVNLVNMTKYPGMNGVTKHIFQILGVVVLCNLISEIVLEYIEG